VRVQKELLVISVNSIKEQLSVSRSRLSEVVSTDSFKGAVKDAINQKVTNYQIPLVDNYVNALDSIVSRYDGLVKLFQDTVSETDNSAIIKTEYLERIKQRMKDPIEGLKSSSSKTKNIYAGISDILTLTNPSLDSVNTSYNQAVKSLDDTIKNMETFNQLVGDSSFTDLINVQNKQLKFLALHSSTPFTEYAARTYYRSTSFKNDVAEYTKAVHSGGKKVELQNDLAKRLAESKYSGEKVKKLPPGVVVDDDFSDLDMGFEAYAGKTTAGDTNLGGEVSVLKADVSAGVIKSLASAKEGKKDVSKNKKNSQKYGIGAKAKAKITGAEAEGHARWGDDSNDIHAKLSDSAYTASADASGEIGFFTNREGKLKGGVQLEAGADAYIVEGEAKAGFKIFGLTIDVSASAGVGVSARAKVGVTTEKAEAKMKLGPFGLGLSIGW
ncbi:LXG domain of WXG superfamily protein, partial [Streptococcus sp. NLAE-zl-C503]|uniref:LXG domain-containing protein n=1 Tax=Streptococcus sp. NLAE-zl-C503 TaxID=1855327 RepID=UPI0008828800